MEVSLWMGKASLLSRRGRRGGDADYLGLFSQNLKKASMGFAVRGRRRKSAGDVRAADRPPLGRAVSREMEFGKSASDGEAAARAPRRCARGLFAGDLQIFTVELVATLGVDGVFR